MMDFIRESEDYVSTMRYLMLAASVHPSDVALILPKCREAYAAGAKRGYDCGKKDADSVLVQELRADISQLEKQLIEANNDCKQLLEEITRLKRLVERQ